MHALFGSSIVVPSSSELEGTPHSSGTLPRDVAGLLFDPENVLYDSTVWRRWLLRVLTQLGVHTNYRSFFHLWDRDFLADVCRGRREFGEAFQAFLLAVGLSLAQIDEVEAACQARRNQWEATARLLPGVKTTLQRLHAGGIIMGLLCDSEHPADLLAERFRCLGVGDLFHVVIASIDLGRIKPDPVCYRTALDALGLPPGQVAFVGDDAEELAGAANLGMPTIAFNFDLNVRADVFLTRFEELLDLVSTTH